MTFGKKTRLENRSAEEAAYQQYVGQIFLGLRLEAGLSAEKASAIFTDKKNYYAAFMETGMAGAWRQAQYLKYFEEDPRVVLPDAYFAEAPPEDILKRKEELLALASRQIQLNQDERARRAEQAKALIDAGDLDAAIVALSRSPG